MNSVKFFALTILISLTISINKNISLINKNINKIKNDVNHVYSQMEKRFHQIEIKKSFKKILLPRKYKLELLKISNNYELFKKREKDLKKNSDVINLKNHLKLIEKIKNNIYNATNAIML